MGNETGIAWTQKTWNPIQGCTKVSPGCKNCYMYSEKTRYGQDPSVVVRSKDATFYAPLKWKNPALCFTCSWSDWFHEDADQWRNEMWDIVRRTPHITYQILTKRADRIKDHLPADWGEGWANVWLGVSVENQGEDWRIRELLKIPASVRFLSCEPLLGTVDLSQFQPFRSYRNDPPTLDDLRGLLCGIHWVIVGGESDGLHGANARECNLDWIHAITEQCGAADVPVFVKQLGAKPYYLDSVTGAKVPYPITSPKGDKLSDFPCHFRQEWPKVWQDRLDEAEAAAIAVELSSARSAME